MNRRARHISTRSFGLAGIVTLFAGLVAAFGQSAAPKKPYSTWSDFGGSMDSMQYSALEQINKTNVSKLELAWTHPVPGERVNFPFNPLVVDGFMYVIDEGPSIVALDATTGKQIWSHPVDGTPTYRGFNYWESKDRSDRRIIFSVNSYLQEVNALTGATIDTFGDDGRVNLREGLGRDVKNVGTVQSGSPGHVFENLIILGSAPGELYDSPPGDLRAYDVLTGKTVWTFHTVPRPGEFGYDTWPKDAWKYAGGDNTWSEFAIDEKRGIAYFPLGSPTYDLYGADRIGADLFGDCLLVLDARTGKLIWYFQDVHHDLWDYDLVAGPKLLTIRHDGKKVDVVAQAGKTGFLYVLNRVTGEPIWPIEERPVPKSDVPGEQSWPTQPYPTKPPPFCVQKFGVDQINPYLDESEKARIRNILVNARNEGIFTPPVVGRTQIEVPGAHGSANWGATAGDPATGMIYVRAWDGADTRVLEERQPPSQGGSSGLALYSRTCAVCHGPDRTNLPAPAKVESDAIKATVRNGKGEMPPIAESALSAQDLDMIIDYLANPAASGPRAAQPAQPGQPPRPPRPLMAPPPPGQTRYWGPFGNPFNASNGMPAIAPPWSELVAYDLNEGVIKWRTPLGSIPALAAQGIRNTGSVRPRNGPVVTAGGLIFVGSNGDGYIHAFDKETGKVLWESQIEANPDGIPAVYEVGGREYVAFYGAAGGDGIVVRQAKPEAQGYYVFALPNSDSKSKKKGE
jgi:quinoprotein glucose dehydrogenase